VEVIKAHQWLEEHLGFDDKFNHIGRVDLYMPIDGKE
jgi:AraC family transcriptional regulator